MRKWVLPFVILALLTSGGCAGKKSGGMSKKVTPEKEYSKLSFVKQPLSQAPDEVKEEVEKNLHRESSGLIKTEGEIWVFLTRGQKRTAGYQVSITEVRLRKGKTEPRLTVFYKYTDPPPGSFAAQVLIYPVELIMLKGIEHTIGDVEFIMLR